MKPPKRISEILRRKELFLDEVRSKLENTALRLQTRLFEEIISEIIPKLEVKDGLLLDNANNYRLISELEKVYETFNTTVAETILPQINKGTEAITKLGTDYFGLVLTTLPARFDTILESTKTLTDLRLGLRMGKMIRGGVLMNNLRIDPADFQHKMSQAVTSQINMKEFIGVIKEYVNGTDVKSGVLDRQFQRFTYNTYQQYDAAYNKKLAEEFDMKYFVYQGGLIKDSRDFCAAHNDKVWSVEESEEWRTWTPAKGQYPVGWEVKAKDVNAVPSYMSYPEYDPLVDRGGYNCRHIIGYIPDSLAFRLRPDLK